MIRGTIHGLKNEMCYASIVKKIIYVSVFLVVVQGSKGRREEGRERGKTFALMGFK